MTSSANVAGREVISEASQERRPRANYRSSAGSGRVIGMQANCSAAAGRAGRRFAWVSFDVSAEAYGRFMGQYSEPLAVQFAELAGVVAGQRVLDVGCGAGA